MIYQIKHTNNRQSFWGNKFFRLFVVCLLTVGLVFTFTVSENLRSFTASSLSGIFGLGDYFSQLFLQTPKNFSSKISLVEENIKLTDQIESMRISLIDYETIIEENKRLHVELGLKPDGNFISSKIVARPPQIPLDSLFLDKGISDGIAEGDLVLVGERVLIGKVVEVSNNTSTVTLSSFPDFISYGHVERTGEALEVVGAGGGSMKARVPIDFDVEINDKIILESTRAYTLAVVGSIESNSASGFKDLLMLLPFNIAKTRVVFVEKIANE